MNPVFVSLYMFVPFTLLNCVLIFVGERIDFDDKQWSDVHVIAGALKWYFRELPEPLIPAWSFDRFIEAISKC